MALKVEAIREVQVPENPIELKSFLGMVNYYRRFIPDIATLAHSLNGLLAFRGNGLNNVKKRF